MLYIITFSLICLGGIAVVLSLIFGIRAIIKKRWGGLVAWGIVLLVSVMIIAGSGLVMVLYATNSVIDEARSVATRAIEESRRHTAKAGELLALTPENLRPGIDPDFFSSEYLPAGLRRPLRFPFSVVTNSSSARSDLCVNSEHGKTDLPETPLIVNIMEYSFDGKYLMCRAQNLTGELKWILYDFDTRTRTDYPDEKSMISAAADKSFTGPLPMQTPQDHISTYWK